MSGRVLRIGQRAPRGGVAEEPHLTSRGGRLADPAHGAAKHHAAHAVFARSLIEAAALVEDEDFSL